MFTAESISRDKDETIELRKVFDDSSTEWVPWKQVKDELRQLGELWVYNSPEKAAKAISQQQSTETPEPRPGANLEVWPLS